MWYSGKPHVLVLGGNFAGLTTARFIRERCKTGVNLTVIDRKPFRPEIICMGDMGRDKAFYIHSDVWYGGKTSILKMGHIIFAFKLAFKEMYYHTGGKPSRWGLPLTELITEHIF